MAPLTFSYGRRLLLAVLTRTSPLAVAARCRVTRIAVVHWTSGTTAPSQRAAAVLFVSYGIPVDAWRRIARRSVESFDTRRR